MKYTHYAPNAPVYLIEQDATEIEQALTSLKADQQRVALIAPSHLASDVADFNFSVGQNENLQQHSARLYDALRLCDKTDATIILATTTTNTGVGAAIMNRLEKAAVGYWSR